MSQARFPWTEVLAYHLAGHSLSECRRKVRLYTMHYVDTRRDRRRATIAALCTRQMWAAAARRMTGMRSSASTTKAIATGSAECASASLPKASWAQKLSPDGRLQTRPIEQRWPIDRVLRESKEQNSQSNAAFSPTGHLKNRCDECGLAEWRGKPLSIQIDHISTVRATIIAWKTFSKMLCPNCHSQTETLRHHATNEKQ